MTAKHTPRTKPVPGHKRGQVGIRMFCECGWGSATFFGKGALYNANADWDTHRESHRAAIAKATGAA